MLLPTPFLCGFLAAASLLAVVCSSALGKPSDKILLSNNPRNDYYDFFIVSGQILTTWASCMAATK